MTAADVNASVRVLDAVGRLQDATSRTDFEPLVDELLDAITADTTMAQLRQEIEFERAAIEQAVETLESRTACHCHLWVEFPRISEIRGPNPPRACPRCKALDAITEALARV